MKIKNQLPNLITCGNLFCGCVAVVFALRGELNSAAYLVGLGALLDFLDGFVARLLKVHSEIGKQLDSFADMVTFGLVPGLIIFVMLRDQANDVHLNWIPYTGFLITLFSAIRLAKFNTDARQSDSFIGVPTPASAIFICSLPLIINFQPQLGGLPLASFLQNPFFLVGVSVIISFLLVAEIPLFALKFKNFQWQANRLRFSFLIISFLLLILFHFIAIPFILFLYIGLSILNNQSEGI